MGLSADSPEIDANGNTDRLLNQNHVIVLACTVKGEVRVAGTCLGVAQPVFLTFKLDDLKDDLGRCLFVRSLRRRFGG